MFRLIFKTFYGKPNKKEIYDHIHESPYAMTFPLILLSLLSFAFAFTAKINPLKSTGWFKDLIYSFGKSHNFLDMKYVNNGIKASHYDAMYLSLAVASIGITLSLVFYYFRKFNLEKISSIFNTVGLYNLSRNKFYIDAIYSKIIYKPFMKFSKLSSIIDWDIYDQKIID